jgi:hypothetical protein
MRIFLSARSIFLILFLFGLPAIVGAQDGEPNLDSSIDYAFGKELRFLLSAENGLEVERIMLFFRPELSTEIYVVDVPFEPGETLSVTHPIDVTMINLKPYSRVTYSWQLETDEESRNIPEQSFLYEDDRFAWQQMTRDGATVHWTDNGPSFGQDALNVTDEALLSLSTVLPLENISPFDIYLYPSLADLRVAVELADLDSEETIHPDLGVILVTAANPESAVFELGQSIPYELAHLLIYQVAGESYEEIPWWLTEGLGTIFQPKPNPRFAQILDEAVQTDATIPLWELCETPVDREDRTMLARAQSLSVVEYIRSRFGDQILAELVRNYAQGSDCQSGVQSTLDMTLDQLEAAWLDVQGIPSAPVQLFNEFGLWIVMLSAGFGFTWMLVRYSTRGRNFG